MRNAKLFTFSVYGKKEIVRKNLSIVTIKLKILPCVAAFSFQMSTILPIMNNVAFVPSIYIIFHRECENKSLDHLYITKYWKIKCARHIQVS